MRPEESAPDSDHCWVRTGAAGVPVLKHGLGPCGTRSDERRVAFQGTSRKRPSPSFSSGIERSRERTQIPGKAREVCEVVEAMIEGKEWVGGNGDLRLGE
jgi:hypothetical protein